MESFEKNNIDKLIDNLLDKAKEEPMKYGDQLVRIGGSEVHEKLLHVLKTGDMDDAFLATRVLAMMDNKPATLDALFEVIHLPANQQNNGGLVSLVEEFDIIDKFVDLFRIYIFGNFKSSSLAKVHLDYAEFDITPRTLKKAEKHWNHFLNNASKNDGFELIKAEAGTILEELKEILEEEE
ncbi:hypothetical protein [Cyclobacterium qasimii]|uniref:HEAT repeat domain-containing protein n=2 Tax=Cyclobacterium qasimii TaxID=1350429 RepID=S7WTT7_9BACT|nr:hypothetical protein [Cyclobacterium qasimii]EPR67518.1 hypothetical protein ADICYQ_3542 [Cyclobacterium qasimii M12-11B]GEO21742.1 hypothetical protein CQA01_22760 [Cyclobacterium qasimii]